MGKLVKFALFELGMSALIGIFILYLTFWVVNKVVKRHHIVGDDNVAYAIFVGAILFSVGYLVSSVIDPLLSTYRMLSTSSSGFWGLAGQFSRYMLLFMGISTLIAFFVNIIGIALFTSLTTKIKELEEISKNNVSVAIITAIFIIVLSLFIKDGLIFLLEAIVPYPDLPQIS